jgi:hydroxymethylpyrimidine/phosphomethylpyrimidine kinase
VQASSLPIVLIFGPFDPSGSSSLPADAVTCATLGCHALSTLTAIRVQDTVGIEEIQPVAPELIDDQARCLLEDMAVQAIKIGPLYTPESVSALAQIAADYNQVPLVLHLTAWPDEAALEDIDSEDVLSATLELLLPQTDIVIADHNLMVQWQAEGLLSTIDAASPAQALLQCGAKWVLSTAAPIRPGQSAYLLQGQENETFNWAWQAPAARLHDADGPLVCAVACQLAMGLDAPQAVEAAIKQAMPLAANSFKPGMGHPLINRSPS